MSLHSLLLRSRSLVFIERKNSRKGGEGFIKIRELFPVHWYETSLQELLHAQVEASIEWVDLVIHVMLKLHGLKKSGRHCSSDFCWVLSISCTRASISYACASTDLSLVWESSSWAFKTLTSSRALSKVATDSSNWPPWVSASTWSPTTSSVRWFLALSNSSQCWTELVPMQC